MIDLSTLTLGEVARIEELSGQSISSIGVTEAPKGKAMAAIAMTIKRRNGEPNFTFNAALALSMDEVNALLGVDDDEVIEDPEEGKDERSAKSATKSKRPSSSTSA